MLNSEDNRLLTQVSAGTPGGEVIRHYWLPFLFSQELSSPDCIPLRVRLLGENLIAWRDSDSRVGLIEDACAHRGASLFFARNEESGLRCIYHGWKYDVNGRCVDMPAEPPESNFHDKVWIKSYPCLERNGIVWTYMGHATPPPPIPELDFNMFPQDHSLVSKRVQRSNWFQTLEGGIDSTHADFAHALLPDEVSRRGLNQQFSNLEKYRHFDTVDTDYGVMIANARPTDDENIIWRINHFVLPFYTLFPGPSGNAWVPIDDENTIMFHWNYNPDRPLTEKEQDGRGERYAIYGEDGFHLTPTSRRPATTEPFGAWMPLAGRENDYMIDHEVQRTVSFSGIPHGWNQDAALQESMGAIADRHREHLGTADAGIIAARRHFLRLARAYRDSGATPPSLDNPSAFRVRPAQAILPRQADWVTEMKASVEASITERRVETARGDRASRAIETAAMKSGMKSGM
jgi:phenylpropionate dioxygenase-like ring-hydroxylating dioxygenase large terminal subunit